MAGKTWRVLPEELLTCLLADRRKVGKVCQEAIKLTFFFVLVWSSSRMEEEENEAQKSWRTTFRLWLWAFAWAGSRYCGSALTDRFDKFESHQLRGCRRQKRIYSGDDDLIGRQTGWAFVLCNWNDLRRFVAVIEVWWRALWNVYFHFNVMSFFLNNSK